MQAANPKRYKVVFFENAKNDLERQGSRLNVNDLKNGISRLMNIN